MTQKSDRKGLGRGLSALLADAGTSVGDAPATAETHLPLDLLDPNPNQPRRHFAEEDLQDLAASIQQKGILQPLIVRADDKGRYQIVAGERRWRAAQRAQLHEVPAIVRVLTAPEVLELAIIENVQRADLSPLEEARGYQQLIDRFGHTQDQIAKALGKSRSHIANLLRLLGLPDDVQTLLASGAISAGHARALIGLDAPLPIARRIINERLSVRETEALDRKTRSAPPPRPPRIEKDADTRALEADLSAHLGLAVRIEHGTGEAGQLSLRYKSLDELDGLWQLLSR